MDHWRIGIDLGGTKIEGVCLTPAGEIAERRRIPSPQGDYQATIEAIAALVEGLEAGCPSSPGTGSPSVGVGMPGSLQAGVVHGSNSTWINGHPLGADLSARLGRDVAVANDANCFAVSEAKTGAAAEARSVFGVILGTGCGGGLVHRGHLVDGPNGIGGEWGHNPLPWSRADEHPGPTCWCGRQGCMEVWVSGPAMAADHQRRTGELRTAAEIAELAERGDPTARHSLELHADRLARGLAHVVNIFDPEVIVLGGGLSNLDGLYGALPLLMRPHIFAADPAIDIRRPKWGDSSGVLGAAWLPE